MVNAHYFQHVPFEDLGCIRPWLTANGYSLTRTCFFESVLLPEPDEVDLLIILGGPMSVNDEEALPWLIDEKRFIAEMITSGKPVLGICLGAQLIAAAMGANVYKNNSPEIGWFPVWALPETHSASFGFPSSVNVFSWHGETFDLPRGAIHLARSEGCENQAFQLGRSVIGLQFHLETTPPAAKDLVMHCRHELVPGLRFVQTEEQILAVSAQTYRLAHDQMHRVLSYLTRTV